MGKNCHFCNLECESEEFEKYFNSPLSTMNKTVQLLLYTREINQIKIELRIKISAIMKQLLEEKKKKRNNPHYSYIS